MSDKLELDALGNPLEIGGIYGYSNRANGVVKVIVGKLIAINSTPERKQSYNQMSQSSKLSVTLEVIHRGGAVYDCNIEKQTAKTKKISPTPNSIFRLSDDVIVGW